MCFTIASGILLATIMPRFAARNRKHKFDKQNLIQMKKLKKKLQIYQNLVMFGEDPSLPRIFSRSSFIQSCCQNQQLRAFHRSYQH